MWKKVIVTGLLLETVLFAETTNTSQGGAAEVEGKKEVVTAPIHKLLPNAYGNLDLKVLTQLKNVKKDDKDKVEKKQAFVASELKVGSKFFDSLVDVSMKWAFAGDSVNSSALERGDTTFATSIALLNHEYIGITPVVEMVSPGDVMFFFQRFNTNLRLETAPRYSTDIVFANLVLTGTLNLQTTLHNTTEKVEEYAEGVEGKQGVYKEKNQHPSYESKYGLSSKLEFHDVAGLSMELAGAVIQKFAPEYTYIANPIAGENYDIIAKIAEKRKKTTSSEFGVEFAYKITDSLSISQKSLFNFTKVFSKKAADFAEFTLKLSATLF